MDWSERLKKWVDSLEARADKVIDWGSVEVPEYVRELIQWEIVSGVMGAVACLAILIAAITLFWIGWVNTRPLQDPEERGVVRILLCSLLTAASGPSGYNVYMSAQKATKAYVAPRVVIIDKIAELAKANAKK